MPILSNILGLDLGSHGLKAVELRQTLRGFEVVSMRSLPRTGEESGLGELLRHFVHLHRLSTDHVVSALAGDRVSARRFSFPFRDRKKLNQAVPFEVEGDSPFDLEDVLVDWEIAGGDRSRAEVVATIAPRSEVSDLLHTLREAGCEPRTLEAEGLVLGNLAAVFDISGTRLLLDLGHRKTTCCLVADGRPVAARTFPLGGRALTEALAKDHGTSLAEAERIKCEGGVLTSGADAPPHASAVLERLGREVLRTLGALETVIGELDSGPVTELTLFGGGAQLEGIEAWLSRRTEIPAAKLGLPVPGHESLVAGGSPIVFAPAIALALRGTAQGRTRMNFRQDEFAVKLDLGRFRRDLAWPAALSVTALVLGLVSIGTSTALEGRQASEVEQQIAALYTQVFPGKAVPANAIAALREEVRAASERAEFLGVYRGNLSALDLLTEISRRVPVDLDILFEELSIDRQVIRMRVYASSFESADRLGAELAKFQPFAQARIGAIERDKKRGGMRFNVTISLAPSEGSA